MENEVKERTFTRPEERIPNVGALVSSGPEDSKPEIYVTPGTPTSLLVAITQAASNPDVDMDKMERLYKMHQDLVNAENKKAYDAAMARAQAKMVPVATNAYNEHTKSKYARLHAINKMAVPIYGAEGISVSFDSEEIQAEDLHRTVAHVACAGHREKFHLDLPLDDIGAKGNTNKTPVHATGSMISYARRYLICMIFNIAVGDDNDGNPERGETSFRNDVPGLSEGEINTFLAQIESAGDRKILMATFADAMNAATKAKDPAAKRSFMAKKDEMMKRLGR